MGAGLPGKRPAHLGKGAGPSRSCARGGMGACPKREKMKPTFLAREVRSIH